MILFFKKKAKKRPTMQTTAMIRKASSKARKRIGEGTAPSTTEAPAGAPRATMLSASTDASAAVLAAP